MTTKRTMMRLVCVATALLPGIAPANTADQPWQVYTTAQGGQPFAARRLDAPQPGDVPAHAIQTVVR